MSRTSPRLFVKLDVDYCDNAKVIEAGEAAELLYIRGLCLAKRMVSTNGVIADVQLERMHLPQAKERANRLIEVGLWRRVKSGYKIVGWLDRNHSAREVRALSQVRATAGRKGGQAKGVDK